MSKSIDLLNLDEVVEQERALVLGGKEYPVVQQSVADYLKRLKTERDEEKSQGEDTPEKTMLRIVDAIQSSIPSCPTEVLLKLTPEKLMTILRWLNRADEGEVQTEK